jgi:hypothetical protein
LLCKLTLHLLFLLPSPTPLLLPVLAPPTCPQLYDLNSSYGNRDQLLALNQALKSAGISPIADVVVNHRWADRVGWCECLGCGEVVGIGRWCRQGVMSKGMQPAVACTGFPHPSSTGMLHTLADLLWGVYSIQLKSAYLSTLCLSCKTPC